MTRNKNIAVVALVLGCILWLHGSLVGLSDDEAYYWVLSQKPAFGYAYHPPAVAWCIALSERVLGSLLGPFSKWIPFISRESFVRFPAALMSALIFYLALRWLNKIGVQSLRRAALVLFSFVGFFALSWMIVPDLPLFLGWMLLFTATWEIISEESRILPFCGLILGTALILLSKYSGILAIFSAALSILFWGPPRKKFSALVAIFLGLILAAIPICLWNAEHEWASILYQIRDRHGHLEFSGLRYLRFWLIQLILAGPIALALFVTVFFSRSFAQHRQYILLWALPPTLIFAIQPAFSDFKIHWVFVAWWPFFLGLAILASQDRYWKWLRLQCAYGCFFWAIGIFSCHFPLMSWVAQHFYSTVDPRWDVTNDLYGWRDLRPSWVKDQVADNVVIGGRYQTASQAAFYLHGLAKVTLLPRDLKEQDEWPTGNVTETEGPAPSKLKAPITFISDLRYQDPPSFPGAHCQPLTQLHTNRFNFLAKTITVWQCLP